MPEFYTIQGILSLSNYRKGRRAPRLSGEGGSGGQLDCGK